MGIKHALYIRMIDKGEADDKIIAVASSDPAVNHIKNMDDLEPYFIAVLKNFFEQYKVLQNKVVEIDKFQSKEKAYKIIEEAIAMYKTTFGLWILKKIRWIHKQF